MQGGPDKGHNRPALALFGELMYDDDAFDSQSTVHGSRKEGAVVWMNWNSRRGGDFGGKGNMRWTDGSSCMDLHRWDRPLDSRAAEWFPANGGDEAVPIIFLHRRRKETFPPQKFVWFVSPCILVRDCP
jgi:hypothetical protein